MRKRKLLRLLIAGLLLLSPLIVALYLAFAKPSDTEAMQWVLLAGIPGAPGLICVALWSIAVSRPSLPEDDIPLGPSGRPDLPMYDKPLGHYETMYQDWLKISGGARTEPKGRALAHRKRAHALWGFIGKGTDAVPVVTSLLASSRPDARSDGLYVYHELSKTSDGLDSLLAMANRPWTSDSLRALVEALGELKAKQALPLLARALTSVELDPRIQSAVAQALAQITGQSFEDVDGARRWVEANVETDAL